MLHGYEALNPRLGPTLGQQTADPRVGPAGSGRSTAQEEQATRRLKDAETRLRRLETLDEQNQPSQTPLAQFLYA